MGRGPDWGSGGRVRIPGRNICRAFRELDSFSDEECARFLRRVRIRRRWSRWLPRVSYVVTCPLALVTLVLALIYGGGIFGPVFDAADRLGMDLFGAQELFSSLLLGVIIFGWLVGAPALMGLLWRDWLLRRALRDAIGQAICANCRQSLLGLPLIPGRSAAVRCPECGAVMVLGHIGLTPEDLLVRGDESGLGDEIGEPEGEEA